MSKVAGIDVVLMINGLKVPINAELLARITSDLPDTNNYASIYGELTKSSAHTVREQVAHKSNLTSNAVRALIADKDEEVISNLLNNVEAAELIKHDELLKVINKSPTFAKNVASRLFGFSKSNKSKLCSALAVSSDPIVRLSLATSDEIPKNILNTLRSDEEADVASAANGTPVKRKINRKSGSYMMKLSWGIRKR